VLIVDDNALNVELVTFVLEDAAFVVDAVTDPALAIGRVHSFRPDLILMDIQLPGSDGLALTRAVKADPATRSIAIVAFTAYALKGDEARMRAAGCDSYIAKPIDVAALAGQLRAVLDGAGPGGREGPSPQG